MVLFWSSSLFVGLQDTEFHGVGPLGTKDLYMLTDFCYMLPVSSMMAWVCEHMSADTLKLGLMPPDRTPSEAAEQPSYEVSIKLGE